MRNIILTEQERVELKELQKNSSNSVVRSRSLFILLSDNFHSISEISRITKCDRQSITRLFNAWDSSISKDKLKTLSIAPGRGAKLKLKDVAHLLPGMVEEHSRNLNLVLFILDNEYGIKICKLTLQNFLKGNRL
jgi:transposase